ncbi:MAG: YbjN domain-containing protein [Pyrinomonadaceae bacterium]
MKGNKSRLLSLLFVTVSIFGAAITAAGQESHAQRAARVLNETGLSFTKAGENIWTVPFEGKTQKDIIIVISVSDDMLSLFSLIAKKKELKTTPEMLQKLLRFNDDFDRVKVGIDKDGDVFVRIDTSIRVLDKEELKANIDQAAAAADEVYKGLRPHLAVAK